MVVEAAVAIGAGLLAHSLLLIAFGPDSAIELITGMILLWRLGVETRGGVTWSASNTPSAAQPGSFAFALTGLCLYVLVTADWGLATESGPTVRQLGSS